MPLPQRLPGSELRRHIPPRRTRTEPPRNRFQHLAVITPPPPPAALIRGQHRLDQLPQLVGDHTSSDHSPIIGTVDRNLWETRPSAPRLLAHTMPFLQEAVTRDAPEPDKVLATVLFSDIVGSTARAAELGDARWRELLTEHHARVRSQLARFRGVELDTAGDGFFARFDGPARAIRCAQAIRDAVRDLGLQVRLGLHTGECEVLDGKVAGIAVAIGARVSARAAAGEVLVSQTVKDLVAGSGIGFDDRGLAELKGVPGEWRLYSVTSPSPPAGAITR
jgi:class 3 adenylate cyclase